MFRKMGMFGDIGAMRDELGQKFDLLYAVLLEIRDELRLQRPAPPAERQ